MSIPDYYTRFNPELLRLIPADAGTILEMGCGAGALAEQYRRLYPDNSHSRYLGVELNAEAAAIAQKKMTQVEVGNVENFDLALLGLAPGTVDCLIYGDVLEHLIDPWQTLAKHAAYLQPGGLVLACIPNVQHWSIIHRQLTGHWLYENEGLLDRTHLRFFSLETIADMFNQAGLSILELQSRLILGNRAEFGLFQQRCQPLLEAFHIDSNDFATRTASLQYVIKATNLPAETTADEAETSDLRAAADTQKSNDGQTAEPFTAAMEQKADERALRRLAGDDPTSATTQTAPFAAPMDWRGRRYEEIYTAHHGFVSHKWTHYLFIYDRLLAPWLQAGKPLTLLEIGVQNGGSLEIWQKYLPPGSRIHGIDIDEKCLRLSFSDGITFHHGSATDIDWINRLFVNTHFDIILDDGSHYCPDVIATFVNLFKKLKKGGLYIVEDLHASYYPGQPYQGGLLRQGSSVEFFKLFIDALHADHIAAHEFSAVAGLVQFLPMYRQEIESVSFYDSFCVIKKFNQPKKEKFKTLTTGETAIVTEHLPARDWRRNLEAISMARALYADPIDAAPAPPLTAEDLLVFGKDAFQAENFSQAAAIFSDLAMQSPQSPLPPAYLAFIAARQGDFAKAQTLMAKAMTLAPERAELPASLGEILLTGGQAALAEEYLRAAINKQPDLWTAYPALAQALRLLRRGDEALSILVLAAEQPSEAREIMRGMIIEMLAERGDLARHSGALRRYTDSDAASVAELLTAARGFACFDETGENVLEFLGQAQAALANQGVAMDGAADRGEAPDFASKRPLSIAFLCTDFAREEQSARLLALLGHLPPPDFYTLLLDADPGKGDYASHCALLADKTLAIAGDDDETVLSKIKEMAPDILINLDGYAPTSRLALFHRIAAPYKLLWDLAPMPPLAPDCLALGGEALALAEVMPALSLPGLGECYHLPELAIERTSGSGPVFICLAPAAVVAEDCWELFAKVLHPHPASSLIINLAGLGEAAREYIGGLFMKAGIEMGRLRFVQARTVEEWCAQCNEADLGLAPPVGAGDAALPVCLWMGRPYIAMTSFLPWSRRPVVLLDMLGLGDWLAQTPENYLDLARRPPPGPDPSLREKMIAAGLTDERALALGFTTAMKTMLTQNIREAQP